MVNSDADDDQPESASVENNPEERVVESSESLLPAAGWLSYFSVVGSFFCRKAELIRIPDRVDFTEFRYNFL